MTVTRIEYDVAYGCFLFCGVVQLFISSLDFIPMDDSTAALFGFGVVIPLLMASLGVVFVGIGFSIRLYAHWPLVVLSLLSLLIIAAIFTDGFLVGREDVVSILYGVVTCGFSFTWFLILRKRWGTGWGKKVF